MIINILEEEKKTFSFVNMKNRQTLVRDFLTKYLYSADKSICTAITVRSVKSFKRYFRFTQRHLVIYHIQCSQMFYNYRINSQLNLINYNKLQNYIHVYI